MWGGFLGALASGGWLGFALAVWQLPWFWSATFNESYWWLPLALLLTFLAFAPTLIGLGVGLLGVRKVKLASIPSQFREDVPEFRGDEDSWSQVNKLYEEQRDASLSTTLASLSANKHYDEHLEKGSSGDEVRKLQELLNEHGASLSVDGKFGGLTYGEVVKFQTDNGLTVDGVVGSQTWGALTMSEETESESGGGPSVSLNKESYSPSEAIVVTFRDGPGNPADWIGIYIQGAPPDGENHLKWLYVNGTQTADAASTQGTVTFSDGMPDGDFEVNFFANNGYELLASSAFTVTSSETEPEPEPEPEVDAEEEAEVESDSELAEIFAGLWSDEEIEVIASAVEELAEDPDTGIDELRALADSHLEERMSGLSDHQKNRLRAYLGVKLDSIEEKAGGMASDSRVRKGMAAAGGAAAITAAVAGWAATHKVSERAEEILEDGEVSLSEVKEQVSEIIEVAQEPEPEPVADEDAPEMPTTGWPEPDPEPTPASGEVGDSDEFVIMAHEIDGMLTYSEQASRLESAMGKLWDLTVEIERVEHTTGIGLGQEFRYGKTVVGKVGDSEVAIAFPESRNEEITELKSGQKGVIRASIKEYQSVLKRFEMLAE
ncbi:MAG: hypothetical protein CXX72_04785 [Methanobacteriota archaeon]|nr:MAG: hypothetical protein CXX72_04785 [Euryarchaeota archaeon]